MKFNIDTDLIPKKYNVEHSRDNWAQPEAKKMNDAWDYLDEYDHKGFLKLFYYGSLETFKVLKEECQDLTQEEINTIIASLNQHLSKPDTEEK